MSDFVILIKPGFLHLRKKILSMLDVTVLNEKMIVLSEELIHRFYQEHLDKSFFLELKSYLLGNVVYALKVSGSIPETRLKIGHTDPNLASKKYRKDTCLVRIRLRMLFIVPIVKKVHWAS